MAVCQLATLPDKTVAEWEDLMRRGLEAATLANTFISAMACALQPPEDHVFLQDTLLQEEIDPDTMRSFMWAFGSCVHFITTTMVKSYHIMVLARRDTVLKSSTLAAFALFRASQWALLFSTDSLFGPQINPTLQSLTEHYRDVLEASPTCACKHS